MALVKKTIEIGQDKLNSIKAALQARTEKEAVNIVLTHFDAEIKITQATQRLVGKLDIENAFKD